LKDGVDYFWQLPTITDNNRNFIDDVIVELKQLISDRPREETRNIAQQITFTPISASKDIERVLGFYDYPKRSRLVDLTTEEHPYYASLGVVDAFTDELLGWAYDRQCQCDPQNSPYYLDCLYDLATGRRSSDLETKVSIASSTGELRLTDIEEAYKFFALNPNTTEGDDHILGVFNSRIQAAPKQADQARASLRIIGKARNSHRIESVATDKSMSYEDALTLLPNVDASTSPESGKIIFKN
jgi:ubiquitin carboxyl-terminal hydrolase 25/28